MNIVHLLLKSFPFINFGNSVRSTGCLVYNASSTMRYIAYVFCTASTSAFFISCNSQMFLTLPIASFTLEVASWVSRRLLAERNQGVHVFQLSRRRGSWWTFLVVTKFCALLSISRKECFLVFSSKAGWRLCPVHCGLRGFWVASGGRCVDERIFLALMEANLAFSLRKVRGWSLVRLGCRPSAQWRRDDLGGRRFGTLERTFFSCDVFIRFGHADESTILICLGTASYVFTTAGVLTEHFQFGLLAAVHLTCESAEDDSSQQDTTEWTKEFIVAPHLRKL
jgi:hypothetical protein